MPADDALGYTGGVATLDAPEVSDAAAQPKESRLQALMHFELTKGKVKRKDIMHFSRQMAVFIRAGIPILDALDSITEEMANKRFREALLDIRERLAAGSTFADAAAAHPEAFPNYYIGMLRTAELSGTLDRVLEQLSDYIDRDLEARRKVTSALLYPGMIAAVGIIVIIVMVTFVLPRFKTFFDSLDAKLPLATRMLLGIAGAFTRFWYVWAALVVGLVAVGVWFRKSDTGKRTLDKIVLKVPALGDLVLHILLERFCRIMSAMMSAGVPLTDAMKVVSDATPNTVFKGGLDTAREAMLRGDGLAQPLAATGLFPTAARQMMRVGEDTGTLDFQLETAAGYFDRELDYKIKRFTSLFEPAVIITMGAAVGFVAIAMVSAMYGIFRQVHP